MLALLATSSSREANGKLQFEQKSSEETNARQFGQITLLMAISFSPIL
jgi:hypothetical protein